MKSVSELNQNLIDLKELVINNLKVIKNKLRHIVEKNKILKHLLGETSNKQLGRK